MRKDVIARLEKDLMALKEEYQKCHDDNTEDLAYKYICCKELVGYLIITNLADVSDDVVKRMEEEPGSLLERLYQNWLRSDSSIGSWFGIVLKQGSNGRLVM